MNHRLNQQTDQQLNATQGSETTRRTFEQAEEVIRADRDQIRVPANLAAKVAESLSQEPPVNKPWWRRLLG